MTNLTTHPASAGDDVIAIDAHGVVCNASRTATAQLGLRMGARIAHPALRSIVHDYLNAQVSPRMPERVCRRTVADGNARWHLTLLPRHRGGAWAVLRRISRAGGETSAAEDNQRGLLPSLALMAQQALTSAVCLRLDAAGHDPAFLAQCASHEALIADFTAEVEQLSSLGSTLHRRPTSELDRVELLTLVATVLADLGDVRAAVDAISQDHASPVVYSNQAMLQVLLARLLRRALADAVDGRVRLETKQAHNHAWVQVQVKSRAPDDWQQPAGMTKSCAESARAAGRASYFVAVAAAALKPFGGDVRVARAGSVDERLSILLVLPTGGPPSGTEAEASSLRQAELFARDAEQMQWFSWIYPNLARRAGECGRH